MTSLKDAQPIILLPLVMLGLIAYVTIQSNLLTKTPLLPTPSPTPTTQEKTAQIAGATSAVLFVVNPVVHISTPEHSVFE